LCGGGQITVGSGNGRALWLVLLPWLSVRDLIVASNNYQHQVMLEPNNFKNLYYFLRHSSSNSPPTKILPTECTYRGMLLLTYSAVIFSRYCWVSELHINCSNQAGQISHPSFNLSYYLMVSIVRHYFVGRNIVPLGKHNGYFMLHSITLTNAK
jgi:hypothetical protein